MKSRAGMLAVIMGLTWVTTIGQNFPASDADLNQWLEEMLAIPNLDLNYSDISENLLQILAHPIDLNRAGEAELRSLFVLSEAQIREIMMYKERNGPFLSVYELQAVPQIDMVTLYRLMPMVRVNSGSPLDRAFIDRISKERGYFLLRTERVLQKKRGFSKAAESSQKYAGSPDKLYARWRTSRPGDFSFGFTAEKDEGEAIRWNPSRHYYGLDYLSGHAQIMNKGHVKNLVLGDFQAQFGQGLLLGGEFGIGKGSESITTIRRNNIGFIPYTSLNESGFFRGAALSYSISKKMTLHPFVSQLRRDGNVQQDTTDDSSLITSFAVSGYHRTETELATRKQINETNWGTVLNYKYQSIDAGLIFHRSEFSTALVRTPTLYNQYFFTGRSNIDMSGFFNASAGNFSFFGEVAHTISHGTAIVGGLLGSLTPKLDVSLLYRNYQRNFISFYSNALAENSTPQNEQGIYWGLKFSPTKKIILSGYVDYFRFPWLHYRDYAPADGGEWLVRFAYQPSRSVLTFIQVREESKPRNLADLFPSYQQGTGIKRNYWLHSEYTFLSRLTLRSRVQFSTFSIQGRITRGFAAVEDVTYHHGRFSLSWRYALFDTDYDNRLYIYERDVWLAFSFPAYEGKGVRTYAMLQLRVTRAIDVWLRWTRTRFADRNVIGSAGEAIQGNTIDDVKLQIRAKF